jgi:FMN phosphatase YigB (HAD superfamily)
MFVPRGTVLSDIDFIVFDWGGTLCHVTRETNAPTRCAARAVEYCHVHGLTPPPDAADRLLALYNRCRDGAGCPPDYLELDTAAMLRQWAEQVNLSLPDEGFLQRLSTAFWEGWIGCLDCYEGVREALAVLAGRGYRLGLLSNVAAVPNVCDRYLRELGILEHLDFAEYSSRVGHRKPHPAAYEAAWARVRHLRPDVAYDRVLSVGDTPENDIAVPAGLGMRTALVDPDGDTSDVSADLRVAAVSELPKCLAARGAASIPEG